MLKKDCIDLINNYYSMPFCKEWQPSKYDMKYRFNTPRRMKKIASVKEKEDAKLRETYNKELATYQRTFDIIDEIATYPAEIASLFLSTFKWTIDDIIRKHEAYLKACNKLKSEYGDIIADKIFSLKYLLEESVYRSSGFGNRCRFVTIVNDDVSDEKWLNWTNSKCADYYEEFGKVKDRKALFAAYKMLSALKEADSVSECGDAAYKNSIIHMTETLFRILVEIKHHFNNNKPTKCETEVGWGVDGKFNGVLTDGITRVSFKSFGAGGYNIQRFHFRFKVTKLK